MRCRSGTFLRDGSASEKAFSQQVVDFARLNNWMVYRTWNSVHSPSGFPDLTMVRDGRLIFAELKAERGKLSDDQAQWIQELRMCVPVYLWRPSDWEQIVEIVGEGRVLTDASH